MRHTGRVQPDQPSSYQWSSPAGLIACGWVFACAAAFWWWTADTSTDQLFIGVVVLVLIVASAYGSILRPRLRASRDGIAVRGLCGTQRWSWSGIQVRVKHSQRLGRTVAALELDVPDDSATGGLVILTKLDLGEDPQDVAETLNTLRP